MIKSEQTNLNVGEQKNKLIEALANKSDQKRIKESKHGRITAIKSEQTDLNLGLANKRILTLSIEQNSVKCRKPRANKRKA